MSEASFRQFLAVFEYEGFFGFRVFIHEFWFLSPFISENFLWRASEFFPSLRFPVSFLRSFLPFLFSVSLLWVYSGQSGFFESVVQVVFRRGV